MDRKPRIFIGSSVESLPIADAINQNLDHSCEVTIWRNGTFNLSSTTIDSLVLKASSVDYAIFIFSPDDVSTIRNKEDKVVRDNVIFELGLFVGTIGKERCYIVKPRNIDLHLPSDLLGLTTADYESNRSDGDIASALNHACSLIKTEIKRIGLITIENLPINKKTLLELPTQKLSEIDFNFLKILLTTFTENPEGYSLWKIKEDMKVEKTLVDFSSIKLDRIGLIQKENTSDYNSNIYYSYTITQDGIDYLLQNESKLHGFSSNSSINEVNDLPF